MRYLMEPELFMKELELLGGISPEFMENPELFNFFEPILRADFEVAERNGMSNELPVKSPLFALMGTEEERVGEISNWRKFTLGTFGYEVLEGDHFFINRHPQKLAGIISSCYHRELLQRK
jgi:surfactin synthase thioesterase subunit